MATRKSTNKSKKASVTPEAKRSGLLDYFRFGESYTSLVLGIVVVIITAILLVSFVKNRNIGQIEETQPEIVATNNQSEMATQSASITVTGTVTPTRAATATPTKRPTLTPTRVPTKTLTPTKVVATSTATPTRTPTKKPTATATKKPTTPPTKTVAPTTKPGIATDYRPDQPRSYTVAQGDNLWTIAEKTYKSGYNWVDIAKANKLTNADVLQTGTRLSLPQVQPKQITVTTVDEAQKITGASYKVVQGDNLWTVAVRAYGDGFRYTEIAKNNNITNPHIIHAGTVLKLKR